VGGPSYIRALHAPFPEIPLIASGGIGWHTAADFLRAGAVAVGIGEGLVPKEAVRLRNGDWIRELVRRFRGVVDEGLGRDGVYRW
jgi:2-dehydro-3-deoxyphosphogluconate aldolase/(4S)-4-hydroxy-2-oxoglutarate aldolase